MVILIAGATGFIGRRLAAALMARGHDIVSAGRRAPAAASRHILVDFATEGGAIDWTRHLANVDVVVNAVGVLRESAGQRFEALHLRSPTALFAACADAGVKVVQISALGAHANAATAYFRTKAVADDYLLQLPGRGVVAQPALVYATNGASGRLFTTLATLPAVPIPGPGTARVQPIHIDDLTAALVTLVETDAFAGTKVPLAGPQSVSFREFLDMLRRQMGLARRFFLVVPAPVARVAARIAGMLPRSLADEDTYTMLAQGNTGDPAPARALVGRTLRPPSAFIGPDEASAARQAATLQWLLPVLRMTMALTWIASGIVSIAVYPREDSDALLESAGLTGVPATVALYGGAALDVALGTAALVLRERRPVWALQAAVMIVYTGIITVALPEQWAHPFGPVLKNLLVLVALVMLWQLDRPEEGTNS